MAWQDIPNNPYWQYDDAPPDPGGAETALWATSTNGIRLNARGEEIYVNCRHKLIHPSQDSFPNEINKTFWSPALPFSPQAQDYFDRLDTAGDTTYIPYKQPLANYIDSLVALGGAYWDDMLSATSFVGVGIQGITVPLRDGMTVPTEENFVAGDLNQLTGLKGDKSTKLINTNVTGNSVSINDVSFSCYTTERGTSGRQYLSSFDKQVLQAGFTVPQRFTFKAQSGSVINIDSTTDTVGFIGLSRDNSADFDCYVMDREVTQVAASSDTGTTDFSLFAFRPLAPTGHNDCRISTYHIGPALDLATLEALQDTLITEVEAVWNTLVYQSDFANGATEWTAARGTNTAPDSPDASTNVMSYVPNVGIQSHYTRLSTSNINLTDEYLTQFEIYIPSSNVTVDGFKMTDWTSTTVFDNTIPTSDTWKSISFISKYENVGVPAIWQTAAGSVSFNGNGTDKIYIRNFRVSKQS